MPNTNKFIKYIIREEVRLSNGTNEWFDIYSGTNKDTAFAYFDKFRTTHMNTKFGMVEIVETVLVES